MSIECDMKEHDTEERVGKIIVGLAAVLTGLIVLVLSGDWILG